MARTFFDQALVIEVPRRGSTWMKAASLVVHVAIVLVVIVLPITAAFDLPGVYTSLPPVMLATVSKIPPPSAMPRAVSTTPVVAQTVPLDAPEGVTPEVVAPPAAASPIGVPGGISTDAGVPAVGLVNKGTLAVPPPPGDPTPRRVGGNIRQPERIGNTTPVYPAAAQAARIEGTVILECVIDAQGVVQDVKVLKSVPLLDRAAIDAVKQWRYTPTRLNGVAIPVIMSVTVMFTLR